jgi:hypothetical protein
VKRNRRLSYSKIFNVIFVKVFHFLARAQIQVFHKNETKNKVIRPTYGVTFIKMRQKIK